MLFLPPRSLLQQLKEGGWSRCGFGRRHPPLLKGGGGITMRPTKVKGEVKKSEIRILPITFIIKQTFEKGDFLPPFPSFDPDQVGDLPEIQFLFFYSFIKPPKEVC
jgi:hypothetical protein